MDKQTSSFIHDVWHLSDQDKTAATFIHVEVTISDFI